MAHMTANFWRGRYPLSAGARLKDTPSRGSPWADDARYPFRLRLKLKVKLHRTVCQVISMSTDRISQSFLTVMTRCKPRPKVIFENSLVRVLEVSGSPNTTVPMQLSPMAESNGELGYRRQVAA